ncbi:hypothetical protein [Brasilonema sp. UFV-L1]|uniref:hypothetical protein n=1 Tax=Brasilonema sp. UFV-L1 TaxID=2234130 RepID=UPI00145DC891|nr:hypothetical protein [Brasilonema sp. UFV-L1]NMG07693.1 hypothetical protein [Brasilonema sp. UFV-L1]
MKSTTKRIVIALSSFGAVVTTSQSASAQLTLGRYGIQPGLEQNYLQYQLSGRSLSQMRGIAGCSVGFGAACNKAGAVFQKLVESNGGPSYEQLLMQAAGGEENYRNFASLYGNNPNLTQIPYASFWQDNNLNIVDGYHYLLGTSVSQTPQAGLGQVTQNFYWAPEGSKNSLDPRHGLLDLKYSYGRLLLEEVAKIPNAQQQISSLGLAPELTKFYSDKLSNSMRVLSSGNEESLKDTILKDLSMPYSPEAAEFGRPNLGIPSGDSLIAETLAGDVVLWETPVALEPDATSIDIPSNLAEDVVFPTQDVVLERGSQKDSFPTIWLAGGALALLLLLLTLGGGDSSSAQGSGTPTSTPSVTPPPSSGDSVPPSGGGSPGDNQITEVPPTPVVSTPPGQEVKKVPEPTSVSALVLLVIVLWVLGHGQRRTDTGRFDEVCASILN